MNTRLFDGQVMHCRLSPIKHDFQYPLRMFAFDLEELKELDETWSGFGYNRRALLSLHDRDYLVEGDDSLRDKFETLLSNYNVERPARVVLLTSPRWCGYVFNPVSFYLCFDDEQELMCVVAEVNNTYGEKHVYVLDELKQTSENHWSCEAPKEFHVSPFFQTDGEYRFHFRLREDDWDIRVHRGVNGERELLTRLSGELKPLTQNTLWRQALLRPFAFWMTMPRILWHACLLHYHRGLPAYAKPKPTSTMTIRSLTERPTRLQKLCQRKFFDYIAPIHTGRLIFELPDGTRRSVGDEADEDPVLVTIHRYRFFSSLVFNANVGLGESFVNGDWEANDLTRFLELFLANDDVLSDRSEKLTAIGRVFNRLVHWSRRNSVRNSRKNIAEHYDLGNDFYRLFLDESMTYSCAQFESPFDTLQSAQQRKIESMIGKACIGQGQHVLEIGCGWGSLALEVARKTGAFVTGITLSQEQLRIARERAEREGLDHLVNFQLCDYRHVGGEYDRIISVEMLEAVGHDYYGSFFQRCDELLKPGGLAVFQTISIADHDYDLYRKSCDWIQKHIFPGGHLPSLTALTAATTKHSRLMFEGVENIGLHYGETLRRWRVAFMENLHEVKAQGFDEVFIRKWLYYMCYCEAGFNQRYLGTLQFVLTRTGSSPVPSFLSPGAEQSRLKSDSSAAETR